MHGHAYAAHPAQRTYAPRQTARDARGAAAGRCQGRVRRRPAGGRARLPKPGCGARRGFGHAAISAMPALPAARLPACQPAGPERRRPAGALAAGRRGRPARVVNGAIRPDRPADLLAPRTPSAVYACVCPKPRARRIQLQRVAGGWGKSVQTNTLSTPGFLGVHAPSIHSSHSLPSHSLPTPPPNPHPAVFHQLRRRGLHGRPPGHARCRRRRRAEL